MSPYLPIPVSLYLSIFPPSHRSTHESCREHVANVVANVSQRSTPLSSQTVKQSPHLPITVSLRPPISASSYPYLLISSSGFVSPYLFNTVSPCPHVTVSPCLAEGSPRLRPRLRLEVSSGEAGSSRRARLPRS